MPKLLVFDAFTLLICEKKMSQITQFCGVKFLAWKSGCVNFLTNFMSAGDYVWDPRLVLHYYK